LLVWALRGCRWTPAGWFSGEARACSIPELPSTIPRAPLPPRRCTSRAGTGQPPYRPAQLNNFHHAASEQNGSERIPSPQVCLNEGGTGPLESKLCQSPNFLRRKRSGALWTAYNHQEPWDPLVGRRHPRPPSANARGSRSLSPSPDRAKEFASQILDLYLP